MRAAHWIEASGISSRIRCKYCQWSIAANTPRNALGRWSHLRAVAWKHIIERHSEQLASWQLPKTALNPSENQGKIKA